MHIFRICYYFKHVPVFSFQQGQDCTGMSGAESTSAAEDFLYSPQGVATVAVVVAIVTSVVWLSGCICYCCWRCCKRQRQDGGAETSQDIYFLATTSSGNGTLSSGYNTGNLSYSLNSLANDPTYLHTSLDSILDGET